MASVEENKASTAATASTPPTTSATELEDHVKDLDIGGAAGVAAAKKDPNSKIGSNYYFFKSTPKDEAAKYAPQPITAPAPSTSPDLARQGSAWNAAGTWEDRDMSNWAHERIKSLFGGFDLALVVAMLKQASQQSPKLKAMQASYIHVASERLVMN